ncbi:translational GTPase TypA [Anaerocellum diazotrophicum]|uniref:Large ribosomal subunit assembly factor BipA n=1 Tax=Caldicellulosiruptor diazotrophicus TaxID=2806205 RepID=A0ABM7NNP3_9FIRM|nr:translational GTPase TypA [Caldicellulosiruptor diazotrophicus]BCS81766.1 GTP-binding protein [Caldicellulosiruptor diazotrophicus]
MLTQRTDIRNIAIIAHVDHGKTTLVDSMLKQSGIFRENQVVEERVLDSNQLEREKGITIMAKNTAIMYKGIKINIIDTPGHADFGSEVERALVMADGVLLVVDAYEGPMPQTKFVLRKALQLKLKPVVVINKIDRPFARPYEVLDKVLDLFIELGADEDQLDFPYVFASAKEGIAKFDLEDESYNLEPLFEMIINNIPAPTGEIDAPFQMIVTSIDYDNYLGRIAIGKVVRGSVKLNQQVAVCTRQDGVLQKTRVTKLYQFEGLKRVECSEAKLGDIVAIAGIDGINIGQTVADAENPEALEFIKIDEPTISMIFSTNDSPFAGKEGEYVTSRHLRERLFKELERNVGLKVEETDSSDSFKVSGRGELHLAILIETMRREGYEFQVSKPQVITKIVNGELYEPYEYLIIDVPEEFMGTVMEKLGPRRAQLQNMTILNDGFMRLEFIIPARGLIGFRSEFLTDTKGNGIMNHVFYDYMPYAGDIPERNRGALIAFETGEAVAYGLYNAQERGRLFIGPGTEVYEGMIVGESSRPEDIIVNVCKKKHLTNMRSATADEALRLTPPLQLSLEECIEFLAEDELLEVTPKSLRLRKKILNHEMRKKMEARAKKEEKEPVC